ncbi:MAG: hypothetical protein ACW99Q_23895, partial [Candidatus Kariarchaeaceae archaeon]
MAEELELNVSSMDKRVLSQPNSLLIIISFLHVLGILLYLLDFYYLKWYIVNYNDGLVPDQQMFVIRGESVLSGNLPYESLQSYESLAPPLSMYVLSIPIIFEKFLPIPLSIMYRVYFSIFNILTSWLLLKIGDNVFQNNRKYLSTILYGMGPFMVMQAAFAGSDECMGAFIMILVVYLIITNRHLIAVLTIGIGTAIKYYPFLLIPYLIATKKTLTMKLKYCLLSIFSVIVFFLPF